MTREHILNLFVICTGEYEWEGLPKEEEQVSSKDTCLVLFLEEYILQSLLFLEKYILRSAGFCGPSEHKTLNPCHVPHHLWIEPIFKKACCLAHG